MPAALARSLLHESVLPTLTTKRSDAYFLVAADRFMSAAEVAAAFGLRRGGALACALAAEVSDAHAVNMMGAAVSVDVAKAVLQAAVAEAQRRNGWQPAGRVRYASAFSGVDSFAEAASQLWGAAWTYEFAADAEL